jgi:pimeloyl-ACP methyl ester carboxylesterase
MKKLIPHCRHEVIQGCGHNVHLEKPEEFVILVQDFLRNFSLR